MPSSRYRTRAEAASGRPRAGCSLLVAGAAALTLSAGCSTTSVIHRHIEAGDFALSAGANVGLPVAASFEYVDEQGEGTFRFWPPSLYTLLLMVPIPELAISYGLTSVSNLRLQLYPGFAGAPMPVAKVVYSHLLLRQRRATPELSLFFELGTGIGPLSYGFSEPEVAVLLPNGVGAAASYLLGDSTIVFSGLRLESPVFFAVNRSGWAMPGAYNVGGNIMLYSAESAFHGFALLGFEQKLFGPLSLSIEVRGGLLGYQHRGPRYFGDPVVTYRMLFGYVALYPGLSLTF